MLTNYRRWSKCLGNRQNRRIAVNKRSASVTDGWALHTPPPFGQAARGAISSDPQLSNPYAIYCAYNIDSAC
jgi:hypothetical protein